MVPSLWMRSFGSGVVDSTWSSATFSSYSRSMTVTPRPSLRALAAAVGWVRPISAGVVVELPAPCSQVPGRDRGPVATRSTRAGAIQRAAAGAGAGCPSGPVSPRRRRSLAAVAQVRTTIVHDGRRSGSRPRGAGPRTSSSPSASTRRADDLGEHAAGVGGPAVGVAAGRAGDEGVQRGGQARDALRGRRDVLVHVPVGDLDRRVAVERLAAGEHLVEQDAGGVDVGAGVGDAALDLLGGEVGDGADQQAVASRCGSCRRDRPGQPEVGDLDPAVVGEQDVLGLHVAVDDAGLVRGAEGGQHRLEDLERLRAG